MKNLKYNLEILSDFLRNYWRDTEAEYFKYLQSFKIKYALL